MVIGNRRNFVNFVFNEVMDVLEKHRVRTWIDQGTLLGAYRDGKFIGYDSDIDFGILMKDTSPLFSALLDLQKLGYVTRIHCSDVTIIKEDFPMTFVVYQPMPDDYYFHIQFLAYFIKVFMIFSEVSPRPKKEVCFFLS